MKIRIVYYGSGLMVKVYTLMIFVPIKLQTIKKLKEVVCGADADNWAREVITKAGYGANFGHSTGHGIGLEIHEMPNLSPGIKGKDNPPFPANTIVTVEPGIYLENSFGVRIEDMVLIMHNSVKNITRIPKQISDVVFRIS